MIEKPRVAAWFFALGASVPPLLILLFGGLGIHGNALVTACSLAIPICGVACFGTTKGLRIGVEDAAFVGLAACSAISFALNPLVASPKDIMMLIMTLAAYSAARLLSAEYIPFIRQACFQVSAILVAVGVVLIVPPLVSTWSRIGRPIVFGFDNAPTSFSLSLGLLVLTFVTSQPVLSSRKGLLTTALISIGTMVFAASMVRFVLIAILAIPAICFVLSVRDRKVCLQLGLVIFGSIALALLARYATASVYMSYAMDVFFNLDHCRLLNPENSLEIRRMLFFDGLRLAPTAGLFGLGLDSFGVLGCIKGLPPHNDVVQAIVEFGWLGGVSFLALIALPLILLFGPARLERDTRFVFLLCSFLILLSMIYGRIDGDIVMFMALGLAGRLISARDAFGRIRTQENPIDDSNAGVGNLASR
jgi:O-antigen ligase